MPAVRAEHALKRQRNVQLRTIPTRAGSHFRVIRGRGVVFDAALSGCSLLDTSPMLRERSESGRSVVITEFTSNSAWGTCHSIASPYLCHHLHVAPRGVAGVIPKGPGLCRRAGSHRSGGWAGVPMESPSAFHPNLAFRSDQLLRLPQPQPSRYGDRGHCRGSRPPGRLFRRLADTFCFDRDYAVGDPRCF